MKTRGIVDHLSAFADFCILRAKDEGNYNATRFLSMVTESTGVVAARRLLATNEPCDGYVALWECGRLDLSAEALVLKPEFVELFTEEERTIAEDRLREYGYSVE